MASANCLACFAEYFINPFRKGDMPSVRNRTKDSSEFSRASQNNLAAWLDRKASHQMDEELDANEQGFEG